MTAPTPGTPPKRGAVGRLGFVALSLACFGYLYYRLNGAAAREGLSLVDYMGQVFGTVQWVPWIGLMMAYSGFYFLIDTLVVTRALTWFIKPIRYRDILPIRARLMIVFALLDNSLRRRLLALWSTFFFFLAVANDATALDAIDFSPLMRALESALSARLDKSRICCSSATSFSRFSRSASCDAAWNSSKAAVISPTRPLSVAQSAASAELRSLSSASFDDPLAFP